MSLYFDDILLRCWRDGVEIPLTLQQWRLINALRFAPGPVATDTLRDVLIGPYASDAMFLQIIYQARKKIEPDPAHPRYIRNIRRVGYVWGGE